MHGPANLHSDHRRHDRLLVTRYAAGDAYPTEQAEAERLVAGCSDCARLAGDIRLLSERTHELTAPRRPRDFRISAEQAQKLRGSWFDRLMRGLAAPGWGTALRPVAGAAFALGLMLVVIGALPLGAASSPAPEAERGDSAMQVTATQGPANAPGATQEAGSVDAPVGPAEAPTARQISSEGDQPPADPVDLNEAYLQSPAPDSNGGFSDGSGSAEAGSFARSNVSLVSLGLLVALVGGGLLLLVVFARRRYGDALIR